MQPHELVQKLFEQRKDIRSVSALARAMDSQSFQGTLHKFLTGRTTSPDQKTAARIAKFFSLPIEAIYDAKVATRVAQERGLIGGAAQAAAEPEPPGYAAAPQKWPFKTVSASDISQLSPAAQRQLERLIAAFIGGPVPAGIDGETWRQVSRTLAAAMDGAVRAHASPDLLRTLDDSLGRDFYATFVLKVEELTNNQHHAQPERATLPN